MFNHEAHEVLLILCQEHEENPGFLVFGILFRLANLFALFVVQIS